MEKNYDHKAAEKGEYGPYVKPKYVPKPSDEEQMEMFGYIVADMIDFRLKALDNDVDTIEDYLENKRSRIDINWYDSMGLTPIMWTAMKGHKEVTKALLKAGADITLKDKVSNRDAIMWAQYGEQSQDFIEMFNKKPEDLSPRGEKEEKTES